jgi:hypothetical protein
MTGGAWVGMFMAPTEEDPTVHRGQFALDQNMGDLVQYYVSARCGDERTQAGSQGRPFSIKRR